MFYRVNSPQVITETIDGEAIMIHLATGSYYTLDAVGGDIWAMLGAAVPEGVILSELGTRYAGSQDEIRLGVQALLSELVAEDLIVPSDGDVPVGAPPAPSGPTQAPFRPPVLQKFTDMQDLILLDPVHQVDARGWPNALAGEEGTG